MSSIFSVEMQLHYKEKSLPFIRLAEIRRGKQHAVVVSQKILVFLYTIGKRVNWSNLYEKQSNNIFQNLEYHTFDPSIIFLGTYLTNTPTNIQNDIGINVFTVA